MSTTPTQPSSRKQAVYPYLIVLSGIVFTAIPVSLVCSCAGIFFTPVSNYFHVPKAAFTGYFSIFSVTMVIFLPVAGWLMHRYDLRIVLTASTILAGLGCLGMSRSSAMWQFYLCGVVLGIGMPPILYLSVPTLINAWFRKRVGFFIGLCMAFTGIGGVIFNQIGTMIIRSAPDGWRRGYLVFAILILAITLPFTIFVIRGTPEQIGLLPYGATGQEPAAAEAASNSPNTGSKDVKSPEPAASTVGMTASQALRSPAFWALALFCGLITMNQTIYQFLPSYAASLPSMAAYTGLIASSCMAGQAIGKVILGMVNDGSIVGGLCLGIGGGVLGVCLMVAFPGLPALLLLGAFAFGLVYACTTVQTPILVTAVFGSHDYTNIYARIQMVGSLASAFAALFWGAIADLPHGYIIMFGLSILIMVAALFLGIIPLKGTHKSANQTN